MDYGVWFMNEEYSRMVCNICVPAFRNHRKNLLAVLLKCFYRQLGRFDIAHSLRRLAER